MTKPAFTIIKGRKLFVIPNFGDDALSLAGRKAVAMKKFTLEESQR